MAVGGGSTREAAIWWGQWPSGFYMVNMVEVVAFIWCNWQFYYGCDGGSAGGFDLIEGGGFDMVKVVVLDDIETKRIFLYSFMYLNLWYQSHEELCN